MYTLVSDPFSFMVGLAGSLGSLYTVPYQFPNGPKIFGWWRELIVIFMAIFGVAWKYRKQIKKRYSKVTRKRKGKYVINE